MTRDRKVAFQPGDATMHKSIAPISLLALIAVSPAQAAPTQITACGTISQPGSYVLARNLSPLGGNCLEIAVPIPATFSAPPNFVTIDLAGFTITGTGDGTGIIRVLAPRLGNPTEDITRITVRNGTITGFQNGVDLSGGICIPLSVNNEPIVCNPSRMGDRTFTRPDVVEGLRVDVNGGFGISASGIVRDNQVFDGGITAAGRVTGNFASSASGNAMTVFSPSTVIGNTVFGPLTVSCPANVTDNTSSGDLVLRGQGCNNTNNGR
jgi:hypothetical protein